MSTPNKVESVLTTAVQVAGVLVPEAGPALELFGLLEPPIQSAVAAMIQKLHKKQMTAQDYLDQAALIVNGPTGS
jgi:hypothetical protein